MTRLSPFLLAGLLLLALGVAPHASSDHEQAREAVQRGEILPLEEVLARVRRDFAGEMLAVELEREQHDPFDGQLVYEVKMLTDDGAVTELYYDARTGELLKARGHGLEAHDRDDREHEDGDDDHDSWDWFGD